MGRIEDEIILKYNIVVRSELSSYYKSKDESNSLNVDMLEHKARKVMTRSRFTNLFMV